MSESEERLTKLRQNLKDVDEDILSLVRERLDIVRDIGRVKSESELPTRDYEQEKKVIDRARDTAEEIGLDPDVGEDLLLRLIDASLQVQQQDRLSERAPGSGCRVLIIGGAGSMGRWFTRFLTSQDYNVEIADPAGPVEGVTSHEQWKELDLSHDVIIVTTPIRRTREILFELAERQPDGLVFDIASVKEPVEKALRNLVEAGVNATSIHPMFGPDTDLLSGQHVAFVDLGVESAVNRAKDVFRGTMARLVDMELETHDRVIAYVLGLSHAVNILFSVTLANSGFSIVQLREMASTTFSGQFRVARDVTRENPHLYYEIQALNEYNSRALDDLDTVLHHVQDVVDNRDEENFTDLMEQGRTFFSGADGTPS